jgi:hypothetical protein
MGYKTLMHGTIDFFLGFYYLLQNKSKMWGGKQIINNFLRKIIAREIENPRLHPN